MRNGYFIITEVGAMKKRIIHLSKSTVSVILTLCMLVSCVTVGLIATDAAQVTGENRVGAAASEDSEVGASSGDKVGASVDEESVGSNGTAVERTVYVKKSAVSATSYSDYRVYFEHTEGSLIQITVSMTDTGHTMNGDSVYYATIYDKWDGLNKIYFQAFSNNSFAAQTKAVSTWTEYSTYENKVWNGSGWDNPVWDEDTYSINKAPMTNGMVTTSVNSAAEGMTVTVTPTGDAGYKYDWGSLTIITDGDESVPVLKDEFNNLSFVMPDDDVTVSATFSAIGDTVIYFSKHSNTNNIYVFKTGTIPQRQKQ